MRKITKTLGFALALLGTVQTQAAQAKECVTLDEIKGLTGFLLPSLLDATMQQCRSHLTAEGYLNSRGPALLERISVDRDADWPLAKRAFTKMGSGSAKEANDFNALPDAMLKPMVEAGMTGELIGRLSPATCMDVERLVATLDPMPRTNMVSLIAVIFNMATRKDRDAPSCPAG